MAEYDIATSRLKLGSGSRVENVQLTPELCRHWLGYVTPLMADAANVDGKLSIRMERFFWDLNAPQNSDVAGLLTIHQATATPGSSLALCSKLSICCDNRIKRAVCRRKH